MFVETNSATSLFEVLKQNNIVVVTGNAGIGKTVTSRHVSLQMIGEGYDVLPIKSPKDINSYVVKSRKSLFIFDDICGRYNIIQSEIEEWDRYTSDIKDCFTGATVKILATCRLQVFQHPLLQSMDLLTRCQFNMSSGEYAITVQDKRSIANVYLPEEFTNQISEENIQKYDCFPFLCRMISNFQENKIKFIQNPYNFFEEEFDRLSIRAGMSYCALLSVAMFNDKLDEKLLVDQQLSEKNRSAFVDIFEASMQNTNTPRTLLKNHLNILLGVYIIKQDNVYSFIHGKIFDISCRYFSKKHMECFMRHGDMLLLSGRFGLEFAIQPDDAQSIAVPGSFKEIYFHRMIDESTEETFMDIFGCKQMKNVIFKRHFLHNFKLQNDDLVSKILNFTHFGITFFHIMCEQGNLEMVIFCISKSVDINRCDDIGMSSLHFACKYGNERVADVLLQAGVKVNEHELRGFTPLYDACCKQQANIVEKLLKSGACPNLCNKRSLVPLIASSKNGNIQITELLLQYGANKDKQNNDGVSALHEACINGNGDIVNTLIKYGANIHLKTNYNETPLYFACKKRNYCIIDTLIKHGAKVSETSTNTRLSPLCIIKETGDRDLLKNVLKSIDNRHTGSLYDELEKACFSNDVKYVEVIIDMITDIDACLSSGETALNIACSEGFETIAGMLIDRGSHIYSYGHNRNPLQLACLRNQTDIINLFISKNIDCNYISFRSSLPLPLHISCLMNDHETARALIKGDADVNQISEMQLSALCEFECKEYTLFTANKIQEKKFMTPLEIACMGKSLNIRLIKQLMENNARLNIKSVNGINPLLIACFYEYEHVVEILLGNDANVNVCDNIDTLCLANMRYNGEEDIIDLLSYSNYTKDISNSTPLHIATMTKSHNIIKLLLQNNARLNIACNISPFLLAIQNENFLIPGSNDIIIRSYDRLNAVRDVLPIHIACLSGCKAVVEILIQNKAFHFAAASITISSAQIACINGYINSDNLNRINRYFVLSPLQIACLGQYWDICKLLIQKDRNLLKKFDVSSNLIACFSGNKQEIEASKYDTGLYKSSVIHLFIKHEQNEAIKYILDQIVHVDLQIIDVLKTLFFYACSKGNIEVVRLLYSKMIHFNICDIGEAKALFIAYRNKKTDLMDLILSYGADINCTYGETANTLLMKACKGNDIQATKFVLGYSPDLDSRNKEGQTALCISCQMNNYDMVELLIGGSANVNICTKKGLSPLYFACIQQNINSVRLLLQKQADTNICLPGSENLLIRCCTSKTYEVVDLLLQYGADVNFCDDYDETALYKSFQMTDSKLIKSLLTFGSNLHVNCHEQIYFLFEACKKGLFDIVRIILLRNQSIDVNSVLSNGVSPLYTCYEALSNIDACQYQSQIRTGLLLLQHGAYLFVSTPKNDTPFHQLCVKGKLSDVYDVLQYCQKNQTCLVNENIIEVEFIRACTSNTLELSYLLQQFFRPQIGSENLNTIFFMAATFGMDNIIEDILHTNIDLNIVNAFGQTALHIACSQGNDSIVEKLLACEDTNINEQSDTGYTPLHFACCNGQTTVIEKLLKKGVSMKIRTYLHESIVAVALSKSHAKVIDVLLNWNIEETIEQLFHLEQINSFLTVYSSSCSTRSILRRYLKSVNPDSFVNNSECPLHFACKLCDDELIDQLLFENPNVDIDCISAFGVTPLLICICNQDLRNIKQLLELDAAVNKVTDISEQGLLQLFGHTTASLVKQITPFSYACFVQNCEIIKILIDKNANISSPIHICYDIADDCSEYEILTPLCISVIQNNLAVVQLLVNNTVSNDVNHILIGSLHEHINMTEEQCLNLGRQELTSFQVASIIGNTEIASFLIQENLANVNSTFKITPLFLAFNIKCQDIMQRIMLKNKVENKMFQTDVTLLIYTALIGNIEMMNLLLDNRANHKYVVSLSLLHVTALNQDILHIFDCYAKNQDLTLECSIDALFICCLKDYTEMIDSLLQKKASTTSISQITGLHVVCFKGLVDHLRLLYVNDSHCNRVFGIQSYHLITMTSNNDDESYITNDRDGTSLVLWRYSIGSTINLCVTFTELACLIQESPLITYLLTLRHHYENIMEFTPLFLTFLFRNKKYIVKNIILSLSDLSSRSVIEKTFYIVWITRKLSSDFPLPTLQTDFQEKQYVTDASLIMTAFLHTDHWYYEPYLYRHSTLFSGVCKVRLDQIIYIDLMFDAVEIDVIPKSLFAGSTDSNRTLQINLIYLALFRDVTLRRLPFSTYNGHDVDLLHFSSLEISYLVKKEIHLALLPVTETTVEKATISQLMISCLHKNPSNVKLLCNMGKGIQNNELTAMHLAAFFDSTDTEKDIIKALQHRNVKGKFNELHIACLMGERNIIRLLLQINHEVNETSCMSAFHILLMCASLVNFECYRLLDAVWDSRKGLDMTYLIDSFSLPVEVNVVHLICFLYDVEFLIILISIKCDLNVIAKLPTLSLYYLYGREPTFYTPNILSAISEMTPLHISCILNKTEFVECIISSTNHINLFCSIHPLHLKTLFFRNIAKFITDKSSLMLTPLHSAILCKNMDIAKTIIAIDADSSQKTAKFFIEICIGNDTLFCTRSTIKPLHLACLVDNKALFETILAKTSRENLDEKVKLSYCHLCQLTSPNKVMISSTVGHEVELSLNILHIACILEDKTYAEMILNANAEIDLEAELFPIHSSFKAEFNIMKYPLHFAAEKGDLDLCKLLLSHGANVDVQTGIFRLHPWHLALYHGYADLVELLISNKRSYCIKKSKFMFIFMLYLMRTRFTRIILPFIIQSKQFLILLSVYRYLRYAVLFPINSYEYNYDKHRISNCNDDSDSKSSDSLGYANEPYYDSSNSDCKEFWDRDNCFGDMERNLYNDFE